MQSMQINKKMNYKVGSKNDQCSTNIRNQTDFSVVTVQALNKYCLSDADCTNFIQMDQLEGGKNRERLAASPARGAPWQLGKRSQALGLGPGLCVLPWEVVALQRVQQGQRDSLWTFGTPPHGEAEDQNAEGLHGAQISDRTHLTALFIHTDKYDGFYWNYVFFFVKGVKRGNSGEQILIHKQIADHPPWTIRQLQFSSKT